MSLFEATANQALADGWGDYDPDVERCDCGSILDENELLAGACKECIHMQGVELVPVGVVRRYKDEGVER